MIACLSLWIARGPDKYLSTEMYIGFFSFV